MGVHSSDYLTWIFFNHKGTMFRTRHLSELMRLCLKSHDFVGLEAYIARFETLGLLLAGTKEDPTETLLLTALEAT